MENNEYRTNRHACYLLQYHLVVVTKYRRPVLVGNLETRLFAITNTIFQEQWNCVILEMNANKDHIHILFEAPPQVQLSKLINNYKTVSARLLRKEFADFLRQYYWKPYFWSRSYFIGTVSDRTEKAVRHYIQTQKDD